MFNFGAPEDTARLLFEEVVVTIDRELIDQHHDELSEEDLKNLFVYLRVTYFHALESGASKEVLEVIVNWYDEIFEALLERMEGFKDIVCNRVHVPINNPNKYYNLAGCGNSAN